MAGVDYDLEGCGGFTPNSKILLLQAHSLRNCRKLYRRIISISLEGRSFTLRFTKPPLKSVTAQSSLAPKTFEQLKISVHPQSFFHFSSLYINAPKDSATHMLRDWRWLSAKADCKVGFILLVMLCDSEAAERRHNWFH